jgi:hypothetical protein
MGYIRHDAIIVTSWDTRAVRLAREKAKELLLPVSGVVHSNTNSYMSFLIAPDGSKEGWEESTRGEAARERWKAWAKDTPDLWIDWVHLNYGGDDPDMARLVEIGGT